MSTRSGRELILAHDLVGDALLVVPVEPSLGLLAPKRPALAEGFVELRIKAALQQLSEHRLCCEIDFLHGAGLDGVVLHFRNVGHLGHF